MITYDPETNEIKSHKYIVRRNKLNWRYIENSLTQETYMTDGSKTSDTYAEEIAELLNRQDMELRREKAWTAQLEFQLKIYEDVSRIAEEYDLDLFEISRILEKTLKQELKGD